ncbi:MAG: hypothetical protein LBJ64_11870 [Deltaproteobacteria bacterium]|jgi:hypothetical protein|nr:hypothetical protein [Deltaproteobacteria bacterium]
MTAPLHHVNQLFLHLPAMGGHIAAQVSAEEELRRQARLEEAKNLHRQVVEIVAESLESAAIPAICDEDRRSDERKKRKRRRATADQVLSFEDEFAPIEAVIDLRV